MEDLFATADGKLIQKIAARTKILYTIACFY